MLLSDSPNRDGQHNALILVILFLTMVMRLRFPFAIIGCAACYALSIAGMAAVPGFAPERMFADQLIFGGAVFLALIATYSLEYETRRTYLLGLRERLRNSELEDISQHDALTSLDNRRSLDQAFGALDWQGASSEHVSVILLDIDRFKSYNDTLGHPAGDECLRRIAAIIASELRIDADMAFRFGGEEFLVLLRNTELPEARAIAERMRAAIEASAIPHPGVPIGVVTASFGVASAQLGSALTADELIAGADAALYAAKRNGRNQVWPATPGTPIMERRARA